MRYATVLLLTVMLMSGAIHAEENEGLANRVFDFPRDHLLHSTDPWVNGNYVEWMYFTGIIEAEGRVFGYQITLFTYNLVGQAFLYDVALSDLQNSRFLHYRGVGINPIPVVDTQIFEDRFFALSYENDQWQITFDGAVEHLATGEEYPLEMAITLTNAQREYYLHAPEGISAMGECAGDIDTLDGYTYYYSHPRLTTSGNFTLADQTFSISGDTWFDHQWGNFAHCVLAWNWFSLRLDNGDDIMLFQLMDENGIPLPGILGATYLRSDGHVEHWLGTDEVTLTPVRYWTNPQTDYTFALSWQIHTPIGDFAIAPVFDDQTPDIMTGLPYYWEGVITVRENNMAGAAVGMGYLEAVPGNHE